MKIYTYFVKDVSDPPAAWWQPIDSVKADLLLAGVNRSVMGVTLEMETMKMREFSLVVSGHILTEKHQIVHLINEDDDEIEIEDDADLESSVMTDVEALAHFVSSSIMKGEPLDEGNKRGVVRTSAGWIYADFMGSEFLTSSGAYLDPHPGYPDGRHFTWETLVEQGVFYCYFCKGAR